MKCFTMVMGLFFVLTANAQFGLPKSATSDLKCQVFRSIGRLKNGLLVFPCVSNQKEAIGIAFAGIPMNLPKAANLGSKLELSFRCTTPSPTGVFAYGGETIGFEFSGQRNQKYFYAAGESNSGRCFFKADAALISNFPLTKNQSAVVFVPVSLLKSSAPVAL